ncbi:helix-turn-helix domain-containing protein [uncultured Ralstonia sp.]|jgi:AraC family ethanolamine operon transcriptional activator|uniref:helix-turn-helix domain-containing protein n=1 Tax=Ralstonia sp. TaxID=54061 RepID=UPI001EA8F14E|nr:helix-turn-helix domain-containing protein [uncultured Ralstonia sp.]UCF22856.1 MAG: helix-turn-helix domain-containing protein [Ralstonia sp.]
MAVQISRFNDVQLHANALAGWEQSYYQITPGRIESSLAQIAVDRLHVFREVFTGRVAQYGAAPVGSVSFAIPLHVPGDATLQGRKFEPHSLHALVSREDFVFHVAEGMDTLILTVDADELAELVESMQSTWTAHRCGGRLLSLDRLCYAHAVRSLTDTFFAATQNEAMLASPPAQKIFRHTMLGLLLDVLIEEAPNRKTDLTDAVRCDIVRRSREIVLAGGAESVTVLDLCRILRVSRRTLQNSFLQVTKMTPLGYLRAIRLSEVRRALMSSPRDAMSIGDAAARFGFFHQSHFTADYKTLFGELPSDTCRFDAARPLVYH